MAKFTDIQLIQILQKAARRVNRKLCLTGTTSEIIVDSGGEITTPDDSDLEDILLMQAECMISQREFQSDLRESGDLIRDGEQTIDTRGVGVARGTFYNSEFSPCAELRICLRDMKLRGTGINPAGPGKLVW